MKKLRLLILCLLSIFCLNSCFTVSSFVMDYGLAKSSNNLFRERVEDISLNNKIKVDEMISSCKTIGKDILPTMINVLFYTYLCSTLSVFVLAIRNGYSVYNYITENYTLELLRFILGSISLIIAIPSSIFIGIKVYRRSK